MARSVLLAAGLILLLAHTPHAAAQTATDGDRNWAVVPQIAFGSLGWRWQQVDTDGAKSRVGPGNSPMFGAAFQYDPRGRTAFELLVGIISTDYAVDYIEHGEVVHKIRGEGGIRLLRVAGSAILRMRGGVPGYFTIGGGALHYNPTDPFSITTERLLEDEAQWMPSAHAGVGIDLGDSSNPIRIDARLYASKPGQAEVPILGGSPYEARGLAFDFSVGIGYVFRF